MMTEEAKKKISEALKKSHALKKAQKEAEAVKVKEVETIEKPIEVKEEIKVEVKEEVKPEPKKEEYELDRNVKVNGQRLKKGTKIEKTDTRFETLKEFLKLI